MNLLMTYLVILLVAQAISVGAGLAADYYSQSAGLIVFLVLYFAMFWLAWQVAVRVTTPKTATPSAS